MVINSRECGEVILETRDNGELGEKSEKRKKVEGRGGKTNKNRQHSLFSEIFSS